MIRSPSGSSTRIRKNCDFVTISFGWLIYCKRLYKF
nr:MAG TPA: hypothetical protein [Bacteriophage sp.]